MLHLGDITKISGYEVPIVDCVIGGSPCQDLSVAGKRAGLDGERSSLFLEQIRIIKEMRDRDVRDGRTNESIRPRYMLWENVPGAFSSHGGEDFRRVLEETAKVVDQDASIPMPQKNKWSKSGCIVGDGWSIAWRVCDAQFWGVPQRRSRIALVADFGGESASEILFVRKSLQGDTDESREKRKRTASNTQDGVGVQDSNGRVKVYDARGNGDGEVCCTITGNHENRVTDYTALAVYGFDPGATRDVGTLFLEDKAKTLAPGTCPGHHDGVVVVKGVEGYITSSDGETVAGTLDASYYKGTGTRNGRERTFVVFCIGNGQVNDATHPEEVSKTLNCMVDPMKIMIAEHSLKDNNVVKVGFEVRRLTPLECERLQGYPDGWTDIGEYINTKGKTKKVSDAERYKALGNSIALPSWKWVLKRLCACYERDATMASLFDGIGGFPHLWEQINGKGSCLWASEIEDFPMAVTKERI